MPLPLGTLALALSAACLPAQVGRFLGPTEAATRLPQGPDRPAPTPPLGPGQLPKGMHQHVGLSLPENLSRWLYWWEHHRDAFAPLTTTPAHDGTKPASTRATIQLPEALVPALEEAIEAGGDPRITSAALVALAKLGTQRPTARRTTTLQNQLAATAEPIREAAALALGIAGDPDCLALLCSLALDQEAGRQATNCSAGVPLPTRVFALCGLGLLVEPPGHSDAKARALEVCRQLLANTKPVDHDLANAAVLVLGMLHPDAQVEAEARLQASAVQLLADHFVRPLAPEPLPSQAQCAPAIARLLGRHHPDSPRYRQWFADALRGQGASGPCSVERARACVVALGQLGVPPAADSESDPDHQLCQLLLATSRTHNDPQTRGFARIALGQIGGTANRRVLLDELGQAPKAAQSWIALALGVLVYHAYEQQLRDSGAFAPDLEVGAQLFALFQSNQTPDVVGAAAVALGLSQYRAAAVSLRAMMKQKLAQEELSGYCAVGLGWLGDGESLPALLEMLGAARRRPLLALHVATGLGEAGGEGVASRLVALLENGGKGSPVGKLANLAQAIGRIGDVRSVAELVRVLREPSCDGLVRAFAAGALGCFGDSGARSWQSRVGGHCEYRGLGRGLVGEGVGVLCWL